MDAVLAEVQEFLTGSRLSRRDRPAWGPDALTRREREVAALAVQGLSARDIAERLFISDRPGLWIRRCSVRSSAASSSTRPQTTIERLIGRIREASTAEDLGPERVQAVLAAALATDADWLQARYQQRDEHQDWMLYPLYRAEDGRVSMLVAVFKPGVVSAVHNHGAWAVIGVYRGRERETRYRRVNDATTPNSARLEVERTLVNPRGSVTSHPTVRSTRSKCSTSTARSPSTSMAPTSSPSHAVPST
jgi:predicted metal-dependent enzyme (double-stranded beta helix superfamily)